VFFVLVGLISYYSKKKRVREKAGGMKGTKPISNVLQHKVSFEKFIFEVLQWFIPANNREHLFLKKKQLVVSQRRRVDYVLTFPWESKQTVCEKCQVWWETQLGLSLFSLRLFLFHHHLSFSSSSSYYRYYSSLAVAVLFGLLRLCILLFGLCWRNLVWYEVCFGERNC